MSYPLWLAKFVIHTGLARWIPAVQRLSEGGADFLHYYNDRILQSPNRELRQAASFLEEPGPGVVDLALGAPSFDLLPSATTRLPADRRGYPPLPGLPELREAIAATLQAENGLTVSPANELLVTAGASAAFGLILDTFLNPGDGVALFDPCFLLYPFAVRNRGGRAHWIPTEMEEGRTRFSFKTLARTLREVRLIVVNSPTNPTGGIFTEEDLEQIAWWADRRDRLIVSDEVYQHYHYEGSFVSIGALPKAQRRTLTINSVSKSYGLAAHRVGWLAGNRHLVRPCTVTAVLNSPFVPTLCQQLAAQALRLPAETLDPIQTEFRSRRQYVLDRLHSMGLKPHRPAGAFFVWVPVRDFRMDGRTFARRLLDEQQVLVLPGELFGPGGKDYIRISYAAEDGRLREGLNRLAEFVGGLDFASEPQPLAVAA